jgi:hypothetical protein
LADLLFQYVEDQERERVVFADGPARRAYHVDESTRRTSPDRVF